jgi:molybdate transport system ATP-binding protein
LKQQRVALAREPRVLLLAEPLSAVNRRTRRRLRDELTVVRAVWARILLVTRDLDEAAALADRLVVIDRGELLQEGIPGEVLAAHASDRVRDVLDLPVGS